MEVHRGQQQQASGTKVVVAALSGLAIGGSLVGLMGFSFLASVTLLVVSSPLLLIFSPLLFFAGFVFVGALTGFAVATAMALTGMSTLGWIFQDQGKAWAGFLQHGNEQDKRISNRG